MSFEMKDRTPARRAEPHEVPPPSRGNLGSGWAEYADGEWWQLNTVTNPLFSSVGADQFTGARSYASRNGFRFESRPGPVEREGTAPILYYVRFTRKDANA